MRNLLTITGLSLLAACGNEGVGAPKDPPILHVTSPQRGLVQDHAGSVTVTGTVAPSIDNVAVDKVTVNDVAAVVAADGSFTAIIQIQEGASLIKTVATGTDGGVAHDTRSVQAGQLRAPGSNIDNAVSIALSTDAFAKIANVAGGIVKQTDITSMLKPFQPMQNAGGGPDCLYDMAFVDSLTITDAHIGLVPVAGGIQFSAEIDGLDTHGHVNYAVACIDGSTNLHITSTKVTVTGTLIVTPNGMNGFNTTLQSPSVDIQGLNVDASGLPGTILDMIDMNGLIASAIEKGAELAMQPIVNQAFGALAGPQKLPVLGHTIDAQVNASNVQFDPTGGLIVLDTKMLIEGAENSAGYIYTDNGMPNMSAGGGFQLGIADDLANELFAQITALNVLNLSLPQPGGTFDTTDLALTVPPMISADPADGKMRVILGDMTMTFKLQGTQVAKAAVNAKIDLKIDPANNGYGIALSLGTPEFYIDVDDSVANNTKFSDEDLSAAVQAGVGAQIDSISKLLVAVPLPSVAGLQVKNLSVGGDDGYVMVQGGFQ
jgi:hypothetical protein